MPTPNSPEGAPQVMIEVSDHIKSATGADTTATLPTFELTDEQRAQNDAHLEDLRKAKAAAEANRTRMPIRTDASGYGIRDESYKREAGAVAKGQEAVLARLAGARTIEAQPNTPTETVVHKAKNKGWLTKFLHRG